jgi:NhaP-type Na+/H+ or K+/H+ antiporter
VLVGLLLLDVLYSSLGGWLIFGAIMSLAVMRFAGWYPSLPRRRAD